MIFFVKNARSRPRPRFFEHQQLFRPPPSPKVVRHGTPLFKMRAPATDPPVTPPSNVVLERYRMLGVMCVPAQSQKWLSHRGQAHGRPRKAWKARRVLPPKLPTQSTHTQCPAPPLRTLASLNLPHASIKMTSPQQETGCDSRSLAFIPPPPPSHGQLPAPQQSTINN